MNLFLCRFPQLLWNISTQCLRVIHMSQGLGITSVSDSHVSDITCMVVDSRYVFTACKNMVYAFNRNSKVCRVYEGHEHEVQFLLVFGNHLISTDISSHVRVWNIDSEEIYSEMTFSTDSFTLSVMMHPVAYLNKILLGSKQGIMQLWNIKTDRMIYRFKSWDIPITVIEQAPAVDVVAVGLADGRIILHNLLYDEVVMAYKQDWGMVTSISFRTDGHPVMATGSSAGHIALWNLEEQKLLCQMRNSHTSAVTGMQCLTSEPLMVTSAADNSVKLWIFDLPDGGGRVLHQRCGHSEPPNMVRHYGADGQNILSAGQDSTLRSFSTIHEKHNKSLGRASYHKKASKKSGLKRDLHKMPPITQFASELSRQSDWDNIVSCHRGLNVVTTWSYHRSTMGHYFLKHQRFNKGAAFNDSTAQVVDISSCGNYVIIGYSSGHVDKYNLQSGQLRGSFGELKAHDCPVRGVAIDGLNQLAITAGADGSVKFWKFKQKVLLNSLQLKMYISQIVLHRESAMLAVSLDDFTISIVDIDTRRVVRNFSGHLNQVTDMTFSSDSRWLISAAMDSSIRTWDLPSGKLIDCFLVDKAVSSLSMSPTGDFLVTAHVDDVGVYLWSNMTLYSFVSLSPLPANFEPKLLDLPSTYYSHTDQDEDSQDVTDYEKSKFKSPSQISDELVTLSLLPNSRWKNLLNLDVIRSRNKPKEPPKAPKAAPFFLPTIAGLQPRFAAPEDDSDRTEVKKSHVITARLQPLSELGRLLQECGASGQFAPVLSRLKELGPSAIDLEMRSLSPEGGGSIELMDHFMNFIKYVLSTNNNFELAQAYLGLFLKLHTDLIASEASLTEEVMKLAETHSETWNKLQTMFLQSLCIVTYLRSATV
ncbi:WD repeat-containing protein 36-like isoform X2 [Gigantopelta aegis]|uniref:WD repeat-containing protein 36-like isoform X2 n=2 Tax=Gigantopelta aegis TaxID=1735272 RepID=UPI001B88E252|nr:WD repeat-containing protein 36-like isoform X2 [Gigantopelta aegis]